MTRSTAAEGAGRHGSPQHAHPPPAPTKAAARPGPTCRGFRPDTRQGAALTSGALELQPMWQLRGGKKSHCIWTEAGGEAPAGSEMSPFYPQALQLTASSHAWRCGMPQNPPEQQFWNHTAGSLIGWSPPDRESRGRALAPRVTAEEAASCGSRLFTSPGKRVNLPWGPRARLGAVQWAAPPRALSACLQPQGAHSQPRQGPNICPSPLGPAAAPSPGMRGPAEVDVSCLRRPLPFRGDEMPII